MAFTFDELNNFENGSEFVYSMVEKYPHPIDDMNNYPKWIRNILILIEYDSHLNMNGLEFKSYDKEIDALKDVGHLQEANVLSKLRNDLSKSEIDMIYNNLIVLSNPGEFWDRVVDYADNELKKYRMKK